MSAPVPDPRAVCKQLAAARLVGCVEVSRDTRPADVTLVATLAGCDVKNCDLSYFSQNIQRRRNESRLHLGSLVMRMCAEKHLLSYMEPNCSHGVE